MIITKEEFDAYENRPNKMNRNNKRMKWHKCKKCNMRVYEHRIKSHTCEADK